MQIFVVLLYYLPRGHIEMKYKTFSSLEFKCYNHKMIWQWIQHNSSEYSMNQILKKYIVTMLLVTKLLMYNLDVLMGIFSPLRLCIRGQPSYKSHQTIKPSKVGFDKHLRMAFYDLRNERITCGNKVSVFWKVLFYLV